MHHVNSLNTVSARMSSPTNTTVLSAGKINILQNITTVRKTSLTGIHVILRYFT